MKFESANRFRHDFKSQVIDKTIALDSSISGRIISVKIVPPAINIINLHQWTLADELIYAKQDVEAVVILDIGRRPTTMYQKLSDTLDALNIKYNLSDYEDKSSAENEATT